MPDEWILHTDDARVHVRPGTSNTGIELRVVDPGSETAVSTWLREEQALRLAVALKDAWKLLHPEQPVWTSAPVGGPDA